MAWTTKVLTVRDLLIYCIDWCVKRIGEMVNLFTVIWYIVITCVIFCFITVAGYSSSSKQCQPYSIGAS